MDVRWQLTFALDEVGCNLSQEKDDAKGGKIFLCGVDDVPYQCSSTKNSHFTCLGLTTLAGEGLMCVIILQGKKHDLLSETGIDWDHLCAKEDLF